MIRLLLSTVFTMSLVSVFPQTRQISLGLFTGITAPYTWDEGIHSDSRYKARYEVKFAPIGVAFGIDHEDYGFVFTPSLITIGQNFHVINSVGGQEGVRKINMQYAQLPIAFKLHVIDLSFFKVSLVAGVGVGYLLNGKETISHNNAKYRFPAAVYPVLPEDYVVEYNGVVAPDVRNQILAETKDFDPFQIFGSFGFRSDWDVTEGWRISLDVRANYSAFETRNTTYLNQISANERIYDTEGKRREIFATLNLGIARYIEIDKEKASKTKSFKKFKPKQAVPVYRPRRG
jgi:hypothetical protein